MVGQGGGIVVCGAVGTVHACLRACLPPCPSHHSRMCQTPPVRGSWCGARHSPGARVRSGRTCSLLRCTASSSLSSRRASSATPTACSYWPCRRHLHGHGGLRGQRRANGCAWRVSVQTLAGLPVDLRRQAPPHFPTSQPPRSPHRSSMRSTMATRRASICTSACLPSTCFMRSSKYWSRHRAAGMVVGRGGCV